MTQANPTTSDPSPLPPTYGPRPIVESNGYLNDRFTDHVSAPMDNIAADPATCDWWLRVLFKMVSENPEIPYGSSPSTNPTGETLIKQLKGEACRKGLVALEKVKNKQNWVRVKELFGLLENHLWQKRAQSADWRQAYPGLYESKCGARHIPPFFDDAQLVMVSHYAGVPQPSAP
jgi:hypothetical protein